MGDLAFAFAVSCFVAFDKARRVFCSLLSLTRKKLHRCVAGAMRRREKRRIVALDAEGGRVGKWWVVGVRRSCEQTECKERGQKKIPGKIQITRYQLAHARKSAQEKWVGAIKKRPFA